MFGRSDDNPGLADLERLEALACAPDEGDGEAVCNLDRGVSEAARRLVAAVAVSFCVVAARRGVSYAVAKVGFAAAMRVRPPLSGNVTAIQ